MTNSYPVDTGNRELPHCSGKSGRSFCRLIFNMVGWLRSIEMSLSILPVLLVMFVVPRQAISDGGIDFGQMPASGHYPLVVLQQMWRNQLYDLAADHCESQRALVPPGSDAYALWTMWWMEGLSRDAVDRPASAKETLAKLDRLVEKFRDTPTPPRRLHWIEYQRLKSLWFEAQLQSSLYLAAQSRTTEKERALALVRQLLDESEGVRKRVEATAAAAARNVAAKDAIPQRQYLLLVADLLLLEVDSYRIRTDCYPRGSDDRIAAVSKMHEAITLALGRVPADWKGRNNLEIARADGYLAIGEYEKGLQILESTIPGIRERALLLQAMASLSDAYRLLGKMEQAKKVLVDAGDIFASPYLAMAELEYQLAVLASVGSDSKESSDKLRQAIELKSKIGKAFGGHWLQRTEAKLASSSSSSKMAASSSTDVAIELLRTEAKQRLAGGQVEEALSKLFEAESKARQDNHRSAAFSLSVERGALLQANQRMEEAIEVFAKGAREEKDDAKAPSAHLMACWIAVQRFANRSTENVAVQPGQSEKIISLLDEHVKYWPKNETAKQARLWLDRFLISSDRLGEATDRWTQWLEHGDADPSILVHAVGRAGLETVAHRLGVNGIHDSKRIDQVLQQLEEGSTGSSRRDGMLLAKAWLQWIAVDRRWSDILGPEPLFSKQAHRATILDLKGIADLKGMDASPLSGLLKSSIEVGLALEGSEPQGFSLDACVASLQSNEARWIAWPYLESLMEMLERGSVADRKRWIPLVEELMKQIDGLELPPKLQTSLALRRASIGARIKGWSGDLASAETELVALLKANPSHPILLSSLAELTLEKKTKGLDAILDVYQRIGAKVNSGSPFWLESRVRIAAAYLQAGKKKETVNALRLIQTTYPELPEDWRKRIKALEERASQP